MSNENTPRPEILNGMTEEQLATLTSEQELEICQYLDIDAITEEALAQRKQELENTIREQGLQALARYYLTGSNDGLITAIHAILTLKSGQNGSGEA